MNQIKFITSSQGTQLAYQFINGNSPVVVFLPGYKSDMAGTKALMFSQLCEQNNQAYLRLDYSGHGVSGGDFVDGTVGRWSRDVIEIIQAAIGDRPVILVGSSMGGWVMLLTALKLKSQVAGILGIAVAPDFTEELMWNGFSDRQKTQLESEGILYLPSDYEEPYPVTYKAILDGRENLLLTNEINISCPSRFIHGMLDKDVPWQTTLRTINQLTATDVQMRLLKDGDHRLSNEKQLIIIQQMLEDLIVTTNKS